MNSFGLNGGSFWCSFRCYPIYIYIYLALTVIHHWDQWFLRMLKFIVNDFCMKLWFFSTVWLVKYLFLALSEHLNVRRVSMMFWLDLQFVCHLAHFNVLFVGLLNRIYDIDIDSDVYDTSKLSNKQKIYKEINIKSMNHETSYDMNAR